MAADSTCSAISGPPGSSLSAAVGRRRDGGCALLQTHKRNAKTLPDADVETVADPEDVDAWIFLANFDFSAHHRNFFTPGMKAIAYGLSLISATTRFVDMTSAAMMIQGVSTAVAAGKRPLVVAFGATDQGAQAMHSAKAAGAYLVLYQSEPWPQIFLERAQTAGADEIWDYSRVIMATYQGDVEQTVRYVPIGYAPGLEVGVNDSSALRIQNAVGYMGLDKPDIARYREALGDSLVQTLDTWHRDDLRTFLETYPVQLNMHKLDTDSQPLEVFRISELLCNKACVVSPPISDGEPSTWQSVVHFASVDETPAVVQHLWADLAACRSQSYETFKLKFDSRILLNDSGFFQTWVPS